MDKVITLAHGSGGKLTHDLIRELFQKYFHNDLLLQNGDSAVFDIKSGKLAFSTDSYVITPLTFKGGDIGKLAVCGTVNDLSVSGAVPKYLSCGFIIEEGLPYCELESIVKSMSCAALEAGVQIVTGDTKVVQKGCADKLFINTSGIGIIPDGIELSTGKIQKGDKVLVSGTIGDHGTSILAEREGFFLTNSISSDCAPLNGLASDLLRELGTGIRFMRDPTRGGLAATLNEIVEDIPYGIKLHEDMIPVQKQVKGMCDMLGIDPLYMANEGKLLVIVDDKFCEIALEVMKNHKYGVNASIIGEIEPNYPGRVYLATITGGKRVLDMPVGDQLPRIC